MCSEYRIEYFGAKWCGPCERIKPLLTSYCELQRNLGKRIELNFHDIDDSSEDKIVQKLGVNAIPSIFVYSGDECKLAKANGMQQVTDCISGQ